MTKTLSPLTLALCAGCLVLGSTGGAVAGAKITGKQIKNESVTGKDVKDRSLTAKDLAAGTVSGPEGPAGPAGPKGNNGANGTNGTNGTNGSNGTDGVSGYQTLSATDATVSGGFLTASRSCTGGRTLISAFGWLDQNPHPVMVLWDDVDTAAAYAEDPPADNELNLRIMCANVTP